MPHWFHALAAQTTALSDTAQALQTYGGWAVSVLLAGAVAWLARLYVKARDDRDAAYEKARDDHAEAYAKARDDQAEAYAKARDDQADAMAELYRQATIMVEKNTESNVQRSETNREVAAALSKLERRLEDVEREIEGTGKVRFSSKPRE